ncbi:MAG: hypothetical protein ACLR2E_04860 [Lachnospiraceae bacterium]
MSLIMENKDLYPGVDIEEDSIRVYEDSKYFAPLIGYTGQISAEEMESLNADGGNYKNGDIVGKSGLEQHFEKELQGEKGSQTVYVDNMGKVADEEAEVNPRGRKQHSAYHQPGSSERRLTISWSLTSQPSSTRTW